MSNSVHTFAVSSRQGSTTIEFKEQSNQIQTEHEERNGVFGTALTFVSIIVGGGIVSVPYALTSSGLKFGILCQFAVMTSMIISATIYLEARARLRCQPSFTAVAQECIGDLSSLLINGIIVFCIFGVLTLYAILFSTIAIALFADPSKPDSLLNNKVFYCIVLGLL